MSWECAEAASTLKQPVKSEAKVISITVSGNKRHHCKKTGRLKYKEKEGPNSQLISWEFLSSLYIKLSHGETLGHVARQIPKEYLFLTDRDHVNAGGSCGRSLSTLACVTAEGGFNSRLCSLFKNLPRFYNDALVERVSLWESANGTRKQRETKHLWDFQSAVTDGGLNWD